VTPITNKNTYITDKSENLDVEWFYYTVLDQTMKFSLNDGKAKKNMWINIR